MLEGTDAEAVISAYGRAHAVQVRASSRGPRSSLTQQSLTKRRLQDGWGVGALCRCVVFFFFMSGSLSFAKKTNKQTL